MNLSAADMEQLKIEGISQERIKEQLGLFVRGASFVDLHRPCTLGDGIETIPEHEEECLLASYERAAAAGRCLKFVPASGAASRMFKEWFQRLDHPWEETDPAALSFAKHLPHYPFYDDLCQVISRDGKDAETLLEERKYNAILSYILTSRGLRYGQLPKALLKFHKYPAGSRTAIEEHLVEAALYVTDERRTSRMHITVSPEHRRPVEAFLKEMQARYEEMFEVIYAIDVSCQEPATNTIAVDLENRPFRDNEGRLCFRPGGHGALLKNMNAIDGDIIFLKNIDNVSPDRIKDVTVCYKKLLAGLLIQRQEEIFNCLRMLESSDVDQEDIKAIARFCRHRLHIVFPEGFSQWSGKKQQSVCQRKLARPLRVCGVVRNEGEPGGGPFWVRDADGGQSLQIVEEAQIDGRSAHQRVLWQAATHFNPVDLVCGVRDIRGKKFNLEDYVDPGAVSISRKSDQGRELRALELPGLWNGSMADWNTIFVEVPIATFNPVKMVEDLLRPQHLA